MRIIVNPPYQKNLHLKILRHLLTYSNLIVNLSPVSWLQDPSAQYKKASAYNHFPDVRSKISAIDVIQAKDASEYFSLPFWNDLGIYVFTENGGLDCSLWKSIPIIDVIINKIGKPVYVDHTIPSIYSQFKKNSHYPFSVLCPRVYGAPMCDNHYDVIRKCLILNREDPEQKLVYFVTKEEAENFHRSLQEDIYRYLKYCGFFSKANVFTGLPWLEDYTHSWTNEEICRHLGLTDEETKIIEEETLTLLA